MIDKKLIEKKLRNIENFLREVRSVDVRRFDEFSNNVVVKRFIERNIELAIEQMIDVCKHFVSGLNLREPETYSDCFDILAEQGIIPKKITGVFKAMVKFRNLLIHAYDGVDDSITYDIYKKHLRDFRKFIDIIREYLIRGVGRKAEVGKQKQEVARRRS